MRRLFLAAALALALHGLLFAVRFEGPKARLTPSPKPLTLSMSQAPAEALPPLGATVHPETPVQPPVHQPPPKEEKTRRQKSLKPEKSTRSTDSPAPAKQQPAPPAIESQPGAAEEIPGASLPTESPHPSTASLGERAKSLQPPPWHEATPLYRRNPVPEYPSSARKRGFQGTVVLEVLVDPQGGVADLRVHTSSGYSILDQAALAGVKTWLFDPGTRGGERVEMWVKVPVRFRLE